MQVLRRPGKNLRAVPDRLAGVKAVVPVQDIVLEGGCTAHFMQDAHLDIILDDVVLVRDVDVVEVRPKSSAVIAGHDIPAQHESVGAMEFAGACIGAGIEAVDVVERDDVAFEGSLPDNAVLAVVMNVVVTHHTVAEVGHRHHADVAELVVLHLPPVDGLERVVRIAGNLTAAELLEDQIFHRYGVVRSARVAYEATAAGRRFHRVARRVIEQVNVIAGVVEIEHARAQGSQARGLPEILAIQEHAFGIDAGRRRGDAHRPTPRGCRPRRLLLRLAGSNPVAS